MGNYEDFERERRDAYRNEARQDEAENNSCPCCKSQLEQTGPYFDEGYCVEKGVKCKCGYSSGISYGGTYLELPDGWYQNEDGEIVNEDDQIVLEGEDE